MLAFNYFPGEILVEDSAESKKSVAVLQKWLPDLHLHMKALPKRGPFFIVEISPTGCHPYLEQHIWEGIQAGDILWVMLLIMHLSNPADLYEILEIVALSPKPYSPLQIQSWLSARQLMGMR